MTFFLWDKNRTTESDHRERRRHHAERKLCLIITLAKVGRRISHDYNCILEIRSQVYYKFIYCSSAENKTREEITEMLTAILSERRDLVKKLEMYPPPLARFIAMKNRTDVVRMCVTSPCELRKCQRIAQTMTYKVTPRKEWFCQLATSTEQCLFW